MSSTKGTLEPSTDTNTDPINVLRDVTGECDWQAQTCSITLTAPQTGQTETHNWKWHAKPKFLADFETKFDGLKQAYIDEESAKATGGMTESSWGPAVDSLGDPIEVYGKKQPMAETELWPWNATESDPHWTKVS
jgi:hypothetical protein